MSEPSQTKSLKLSSHSSKPIKFTDGYSIPPIITPPKREKREYTPPILDKTQNELSKM